MHVDVRSSKWIGVGRRIERASVRRQADAEVAMVESVVSVGAELQSKAFRDFGRLEDRHVPDVESWRAQDVPARIGEGAGTCLDESGRGILGNIADNVRVAGAGGCRCRNDAGSPSRTIISKRVFDGGRARFGAWV